MLGTSRRRDQIGYCPETQGSDGAVWSSRGELRFELSSTSGSFSAFLVFLQPNLYDLVGFVNSSTSDLRWPTQFPQTVLTSAISDLVGENQTLKSCRDRRTEIKESVFLKEWHQYPPEKQLECIGDTYWTQRALREKRKSFPERPHLTRDEVKELTDLYVSSSIISRSRHSLLSVPFAYSHNWRCIAKSSHGMETLLLFYNFCRMYLQNLSVGPFPRQVVNQSDASGCSNLETWIRRPFQADETIPSFFASSDTTNSAKPIHVARTFRPVSRSLRYFRLARGTVAEENVGKRF